LPFSHSLAYAVWLGAGLWTIGGLMEQRRRYFLFEAIRLLATAAGVLAAGGWFGVAALPIFAQGIIVIAAALSLAALWMTSKSSSAPHGYFSHQ
jgi:hypothetical protein